MFKSVAIAAIAITVVYHMISLLIVQAQGALATVTVAL